MAVSQEKDLENGITSHLNILIKINWVGAGNQRRFGNQRGREIRCGDSHSLYVQNSLSSSGDGEQKLSCE